MLEGQPNRQTRRPRPKAYLACDACRRRKSRCDGIRPACSHCLDSGVSCHYRSVPTSFEADASVLSRLASAEARIETLENQVPARLPKSDNPLENVGVAGYALPEFHHGANHKILQYWSRLRVQMTVPDINVLSYIKDAEAADMCGSRSGNPEHPGALIELSLAKQALQTLDHQLHQLPIALAMMLTTCRFYQDKELSIGVALAPGTSNNQEPALRICNLPTDELLLYAIAFKVLSNEPSCPTSYASETAEACFSRALDRLWDIFLLDDEEAMELLLILTILHLDFFHQPFHALALLKISDHIMERLLRDGNKRTNLSFPFHELYYMLQSEIDGIPMRQTPTVRLCGNRRLDRDSMDPLAQSATPEELNLRIERDHNIDGASPSITAHSSEYYFSWNLWLRARLNQIISEMYSTDRAYCKPQNVASIITETSSELGFWYRSLPMNLQFIRDVESFEILQPRMPTRLKEISLRYHSCLLALNRPVLYWVLYEDLENSPPSSGIGHAEQQLEPWVFASCRECIESAKLILLTLSRSLQCGGMSLTWSETQLLVGSFAVLLSVQTSTSFSYAFRNTVGISQLLNTVEELLSTFGTVSIGGQQTLEMLSNMKRNFEASSPLAIMT
ncbi:hypothetical protein CNMCM6106_003221 [Aspergillus hiratsukae]|uniref:Zn(2)-C6 fungal-type domain-containing protein n=1 Tax=Aspergillus hiratsukae TaxID=1194566 RepID=A0A8H6Q841_9EURO|nr:hypothetical protein CNMCM6106_003221 [Aspergillus hiratsukae]